MSEQHCTGCLKLVPANHKCRVKGARFIEPSTLEQTKPRSHGYAEIIERLARVENKLDLILAMASKRVKSSKD